MEDLKTRKSLLSLLRRNRTKGDTKEDLYITCEECKTPVLRQKMVETYFVCPNCGFHNYMNSKDRLDMILEPGYRIISSKPRYQNPLDYPDYQEKLRENKIKSGADEGVICARGNIKDKDTVVIVLDKGFLMGSMGSYVGEEITKAFEFATKRRLPVISFSASGGARMQEGIISLMQMAKTSNAVREHSEAGLLYINVFTNPTTGGVTASFASLADIEIAEPKALIGFAGPRVIKQTIGEELPEGFQRSEFQRDHGFVDIILERRILVAYLHRILSIH